MCGIIGVFDLERSGKYDLPEYAFNLLKGNKNRGQEGYGLSVLTDDNTINLYRFNDLYNKDTYEALQKISKHIVGILGHARYPTSGGKGEGREYRQPFEVATRDSGFSFAFNGNIANADEIAQDLRQEAFVKIDEPVLDTAVLQTMILEQIKSGEKNTKRILENIHDEIDGSCNIALMSNDGSFTIAKDRWGFRPLSYAQQKELFLFSSEDSALFKVGVNQSDMTFVNTGEFIKYNPDSKQILTGVMDLNKPLEKSRCFFETVYFADRKTKFYGEASSQHRYRMGQALAQHDREVFDREDSIVIDVPSSARDSAEGYSEALNLTQLSEAITKNPDIDRTFISLGEERRKKIEQKYIFNPFLKDKIKGKKLILIDDSIVRGSTLEYLVDKIFEFYEPSEIHIRIPSPPITGPCYYAINLKHPSELVTRKYFKDTNNPKKKEMKALAECFGANSIRYINEQELISSLRVDVKDMCLGCINGEYPTPKGKEIFEIQLSEIENQLKTAK